MVTVDTDSVRSMYDDHAASLFAYLARRVGREFAEDLLAETFRASRRRRVRRWRLRNHHGPH